jgi:hypothetical protein
LKNVEHGDTLPLMSIRESVIKERLVNPSATLKQIGDKHGVTKEWVRQILAAENLPTRHWPVRYYICNNCHKCFIKNRNSSILFCSAKCRKKYYYATIRCEICGTRFTKPYHVLIKGLRNGQEHFFCSSECRGRMVGLNYGFVVNPQNIYKYVRRPSKWAKFRSVILEKLEKGYHLTGIMRELGIPRTSHYIIKKIINESMPE